jgi:hypothetical protein
VSNKINHNRPYLRYIDNLRREIGRENRPSPTWFNPDRIDSLGVAMRQPETLPTYVIDFQKLPARQQEIAGCAIDAFGAYLNATSVVISKIMGAKSKARKAAKDAQDEAHEEFVVAAAVLVGTIIEDMAAGREGYWGWFHHFYDGLDSQSKMAWSEFSELLLKEGLPLYFALQAADSPEQTQRLRHLFSEDNWS